MSVSLQPSHTLGFRRPLTQVVKRNLTIANHNSQPVAFKVKTTAPKLYCVRPNSGRVEPGESCDVSVMLQALPEEPALNAKCKDKFLIQSTIITADKEALPLQAIWAQTDSTEEGKVHQQKLRVTYLPAEGQTLEEEDETLYAKPSTGINTEQPVETGESNFNTVNQQPNGHTAPGIPSAFRDQPIEEHHEVRPHSPVDNEYVTRENSNQSAPPEEHAIYVPPQMPAPAPFTPEQPAHEELLSEPSHHEDEYEHHEPIEESVAPTATRDYQTAISVPIQSDPTAELLAKYHAAQAEIDHLRATIATMSEAPPTELRYRGRTFSDAGSTAETDVQTMVDDSRYPPAQEGVPLQVVVIIALGVFITTYLFF